MEIGRSYDRLISTGGFPILVRRHLYIESGPCISCSLVGQWLTQCVLNKTVTILLTTILHVYYRKYYILKLHRETLRFVRNDNKSTFLIILPSSDVIIKLYPDTKIFEVCKILQSTITYLSPKVAERYIIKLVLDPLYISYILFHDSNMWQHIHMH